MEFGLIGCGKMGSAIIGGILKAKLFEKNQIIIYEVNDTIKLNLKNEGFCLADTIKEVFDKAETVLFAIKPQEIANVLKQIEGGGKCKLVMSIMAGIPISTLQAISNTISIARIMPNTCALIGESASSICYNKFTTETEKNVVRKIIGSIGTVTEIDESLMDEVIPLAGSFTAYAYTFMKAFIDSRVKVGVPKEVAEKLVIQSMIGSAMMVKNATKPIENLIADVCSKGGTTLAGLDIFNQNNFDEIIDKSAIACAERSKELGKNK